MFHPRILPIPLLVIALSVPCLGEDNGQEAPAANSARSRIEPYVDWLPASSETLIVCDSPYQIRPVTAYTGELPVDAALFEMHLSYLHMFEGDARNELTGKMVRLWIEGSARFHFPEFSEDIPNPPSIGVPMHYDGCHIFVFHDATPLDATKLFETLLRQHPEPTSHIPAASRHQIAGHETIAWSASPPDLNQGRSTPEQKRRIDATLSIRYWIASPVENVLVVATSADVMAETLRKVQDPDPTPFPASLEEWKHISGETPIWGMRHYHLSERRPGDLSDLRDGEGKRLSGFSFEIDAKADTARLTFLDCSPQVIRGVKSTIRKYIDSEAEFTQEPAGTLVANLDWSKETDNEDIKVENKLAFWLLMHLGHAVII